MDAFGVDRPDLVSKWMPALPPDGNPIEQFRWMVKNHRMTKLSIKEGQRTPAGREADRWIAEDRHPFKPQGEKELLSDFQSRENMRQAQMNGYAMARRHDRKQRAAEPFRLKRIKSGPYLDDGRSSLPERQAYAVQKDFKGAVRMTTKAGKTITLKAKAIPPKAILKGEELTHAVATPRGKHARLTRPQKAAAGAKKVGGYVMREVGYRPDYGALAVIQLPKLLGRTG